MEMTLGSLFDGIGGFPLSGVMHGIRPVWAAEIEPFPVLVTSQRFPKMKHLGSVTDINGAEIEPVDIITFGSPCQDLSVAGKQKGIHDGERSSLFFEAVRIAKAGNFDSIKFDIRTQAVTCVFAFGLSFAINYGTAKANGASHEAAFKSAAKQAIKSAGTSMLIGVSAMQFLRTQAGRNFAAFTSNAVSIEAFLSKTSLLNR